MNKNTKKILTTTAVAVAATAAGVTTTSVAHADTVDQTATQTTNDQLKQAEQNVDAQKQNVQSATSADNQAADAVNKAQEDVNTASDATNQASQTAASDAQAVSQANDAVKTAQDQLNTASQAAANRDQAQADLNQAKSDQAAIANQNANGQLNSAVSATQNEVNTTSTASLQAQNVLSDAQQKLDQADKGLNQSVTQADVDAAEKVVNNAQQDKNTIDNVAKQINDVKNSLNQSNNDLKETNSNINKISKELNNGQSATTLEKYEKGKKALQATVKLPSNFYDIANSMVDMSLNETVGFSKGPSWADNFPDYARSLIKDTKQSQANFAAQMDDILMNYDPTAYDTVVDISSGVLDGTTMAKLTQFAADVLNVYRHNLGESDLKVNAVLIAQTLNYLDKDDGTTYAQEYAKSLNTTLDSLLSLNNEIHSSTKNKTGHAGAGTDIESNKVEYQAYPIMGHPNEYTMDQLYLSVYNQITSAIATDGVLPSETEKFDTVHAGWDGAPNHVMSMGLIDDNQFDTPQSIRERIYPSDTSVAYVYYWLKNNDYPTMVSYRTTTKNSKVENYYYNPLVSTGLNGPNNNQELQKELNKLNASKISLSTKVENLQEQLNNLNNKYPDINSTVAQADKALQEAKDKLSQLQNNYDRQQTEITNNREKISQLQQAVKAAENTAQKASIAFRNANDKFSQAQSALNNWTNAKKAADQKVADLQKALDNADPAVVNAAQQALVAAKNKLSEAETKAQGSAKALADAKSKLTDAQKALDEAKSKKSQTADALAKAQRVLTDAQAELDRIKNSQSTPDQSAQTKTDAERYGDAVQMKPIDVTVNSQLPQPQFINGFHKIIKTTDSMLVFSATKTDAVSLPEGTTASWGDANTVEAHLANAGTYYEDVLVTFPDGSTTTVKEQLNVTAAQTLDQPLTPDNFAQPSDPNKGTHTTSSTPADGHQTTADTTTLSISATNRSTTNTVKLVKKQINSINEYMTREEYQAQQNAKKLPQAGNDSNRVLSLVGLGLATFATMFGLNKKRDF
ncbi:hypothetical protein C5O77_03820 [Limosilactobacillus reuteri]|uniref:Gram-positive cocci surface proteins LPxTG domain-containing protein n=1 Tax=Limosilactobacillus reuteri TaxID=1598 RepID=A0A3M6SEC8_LIMRT|nr:LPXTG cell wall anchor domain-containing protein [Limosilactobacillus reuteri]RMX25802.1 hypothetical protein C5O77_03820 [Limosilactobacillus reuteri]